MSTKPDYANWMPAEMVYGGAFGTGLLAAADAVVSRTDLPYRKPLSVLLKAGTCAAGAWTVYSWCARSAFSYEGKRQLSRDIIDGIAAYVNLPEGGRCLDVGCGSGALAIAVAKRNPQGTVTGIDPWGPEYRKFTRQVCLDNAAAEGVQNVSFEKGNAVKLDYPDETFDAVTSNYVYHNIAGKNKQDLLLETLRVLKKGGTFAIHDLMSEARYGDMISFVKKLKDMGYEEVRLIDTRREFFRNPMEADLLMLGGSRLLTGRK